MPREEKENPLEYTRSPAAGAGGRKPREKGGAAYLAAAVVFAGLAYFTLPPSSPPAAPAAPVPEMPAAAAAPAPAPAAAPAPARPPAREPLYLGMSVGRNPPIEPEQTSGLKYYGGVFDPEFDGYPVAGDFVDVVVDGKPQRMRLKPAAKPGTRKLFITMPPDSLPHRIELRVVYDLGPDGLVEVHDTIIDNGRGDKVWISRSPVDSIVLRRGDPPRRLKLKD